MQQLSKIKRGRLLSQIECEVETLWRTDEMRASQPTVMDEILNGLDLYKVSLFDATLDMFTGAEDSLVVRTVCHTLSLCASPGCHPTAAAAWSCC
jgi:phosphoenolpyruvate carboxylase